MEKQEGYVIKFCVIELLPIKYFWKKKLKNAICISSKLVTDKSIQGENPDVFILQSVCFYSNTITVLSTFKLEMCHSKQPTAEKKVFRI